MKISRITYKQNFAYNPIAMEHIHLGVEIDIDEDAGDKPQYAFEMAKELVNETYQSIIKSMPTPLYEDHAVPEVKVDKPTPVDSMITAITTCTEVATLKTFEKLAKSKEEFQTAYDETMIKLTNKN